MNKIDKLVSTIQASEKDKKTKAYDATAKVIRTEGNTAWVNIPGGVEQTPAAMLVSAKNGQDVRIRVSGGKAYVTGNATSPPTDDSLAQKAENNAIRAQNAAENATRDAKTAKTSADSAVKDAATAKKSADAAVEDAARAHEAADSAQASATAANTAAQEAKADAQTANQAATNALRELSTVEDVVDVLTWITEHGIMTSQAGGTFVDGQVYFVVDPNGDYEVGGTRYSVVQNPVASDIDNYYILSVDEAVTNYVATHIAVDAEGLWIIPDANNANRVLIATGAGSQYTTAGTYIIGTGGVVLAQFATTKAQVGEIANGKSRTEISTDGLHVYQRENSTDKTIAHLGYGSGEDSQGGTSDAPYFTFGTRASGSTIGNYSVAEGVNSTAKGAESHAENNSTANGLDSHSEGTSTAGRAYCHAEGYSTNASNHSCHSEGYSTTARGMYGSHAEGYNTTASGEYGSHAEGRSTTASDYYAHAEGFSTTASGSASHAGGSNTVAGYSNQTTIGKYNDNKSANLFEIGNGTANDARTNAFEVASNGNMELALNTSAGSSTVDGQLYAAITALGWGSAVID